MGLQLLAVGLWSGFVSMDTTAAMQIMISRPLVSCMVTGLILGDYQLGLLIGIYLELIWINELPVGAVFFAEGNIGSVAATAVAYYTFQASYRLEPSIALSLVSAIIISHIGGMLVELMRSLNSRNFDRLLADKDITIAKVESAHYKGIGMAFMLGFLITPIFAVLLGRLVLPALIGFLPLAIDSFLEPINIAFLGAGGGILLFMFAKNKKYWWMIFTGIALGLLFIIK